ncbi:ketoacyl-ACP synthase III [Carboxylicivirga marina]|uniref:ketoacyl-ACP synthase III n=1 Tax=Carboxylicivirga marina TaxID=2800988 RepID=UPI00259A295B|nr:ketoacyl-ACP synthase III [uncultured Carboxylicivirga sp.]
MNLKYTNKKITGMLTVIPENEVQFIDTIDNYNFSKRQSMQLGKIMGYEKQRIVEPGVTVSDLCIFGLNYLFDKDLLKKDEIDALILVTESPDYILPPTSNVIQGKLNLGHDVFCMDINQGCAGHVVGLMQAFSLLDQEAINKVVLLNADVLSPKASIKDRNSRPLAGDGASITIVEKSEVANEIYANLKMDGTRREALIIPAGGFKTPSTAETAKLIEDDNGNFRALDHLCMKGDAVFNFVQKEVPIMVESLLEYANVQKDDIDYFMFHQPNKFMLKKLADRIGVSYNRLPHNVVERFGNANSITVPTVITYNLGEKAEHEEYLLCMAGFGVGLTWCSMLLKIENLDFCRMIEY